MRTGSLGSSRKEVRRGDCLYDKAAWQRGDKKADYLTAEMAVGLVEP